MDRHFLITVSDQKSALYGARFVGDFFPDKTNIKPTLFTRHPKRIGLRNRKKNRKQRKRMHLNMPVPFWWKKGF